MEWDGEYTLTMDAIAAIDAGSNGIRLAIAELDDDGQLEMIYRRREAVRLGEDAFSKRRFSDATIAKAVKTFKFFRNKLDEHSVTELRAVATSATREAENGDELVEAVRRAADIELEIIDGLEEARLIFKAVDHEVNLKKATALLIDMGGGSVELTFARNRIPLGCETMPFGPVRLLEKMKAQGLSERDVPKLLARRHGAVRSMIESELEAEVANVDVCVGTGGNLVRIAHLGPQLLKTGSDNIIERRSLDEIIERLLDMTVKRRIENLGMRPDRADVVVIAAMILRMVLEEAGVERVEIPDVGLKEGLLLQLAANAARMQIRPA